jgi:hypothetical protein
MHMYTFMSAVADSSVSNKRARSQNIENIRPLLPENSRTEVEIVSVYSLAALSKSLRYSVNMRLCDIVIKGKLLALLPEIESRPF